jgi:tetratricopeptide (TPR) repeat protein
MKRVVNVCLLVAGLLGEPSLAAATDLRYAVVLKERYVTQPEASPQERAIFEGALLEALGAQGVTLVDAEQSRRIRAAIDPESVIAGAGDAVITTADADLIVVGVIYGSVSRPLDLNVYGAHLNAQLRLVAADSGDVLRALTDTAIERDFVLEQALFHAAKKLAGQVAEKLARSVERPEQRLELHVATQGTVEMTVTERLTRTLERQPGVGSVRVVHATPDRLHFELRTDRGSTRDLALALSQEASAGLFVWGYSDRVIRANLRLGEALGLELVPSRFRRRPGRSADWRSEMLPRALATALAADGSFVVDGGTELASLPSAHARSRLLRRLKQRPTETVLLTGTYAGTADTVAVSSQLERAADGRVVASGQADCPPTQLTACVQQLAGRLRSTALESMQAHLRTTPGGFAARPARVTTLGVADVYPSQGLGRLRGTADENTAEDWAMVRNDGEEPIEEFTLSASLPGFTSSPVPSSPVSLQPGEERQVPIRLALDRDRLRTHDDNQTLALRLELEYRVGEFRVKDESRHPVTLYHRNALTWSSPDSVASFVTPTADVILDIARRAARAATEDPKQDAMALPVALFEILRQLRYVRDPVNPYAASAVDYVQYPIQTLSRGAGDCDDLAVLYAALGEAAGLRMLLVTTPGHIFVAVPTFRPTHSLGTGISEREQDLMEHDGQLWIPLESSLTAGTFEEAWAAGARRVVEATRTRKLGLIDVRAGWEKYPPVDLSPPADGGLSPIRPDPEVVAAAVDRARTRFRAELEGALAAVDQRLHATPSDPELLNRRGLTLVALGRLDEADAAFRRSVEAATKRPGPSNNLGNLSLLSGDAVQALHWYDEALRMVSQQAAARQRIVLNRLLAAWTLDPSGTRFLELLVGASDDDLRAFYQGVNGGPLRGGAADPRSGATGAGTNSLSSDVPVGSLVHWL